MKIESESKNVINFSEIRIDEAAAELTQQSSSIIENEIKEHNKQLVNERGRPRSLWQDGTQGPYFQKSTK